MNGILTLTGFFNKGNAMQSDTDKAMEWLIRNHFQHNFARDSFERNTTWGTIIVSSESLYKDPKATIRQVQMDLKTCGYSFLSDPWIDISTDINWDEPTREMDNAEYKKTFNPSFHECDWEVYTGLFEQFEHCKLCGKKKI